MLNMVAFNQNKGAYMSNAILMEMQGIVRTAAQPWSPGDSVKAGILRASRALGLSYRRTYTFWYGAPCSVLAAEADQLRQAELRLLAQRREALETEIASILTRLNEKDARDAAETDALRNSSNAKGVTLLCRASRRMDPMGKMVRRARLTTDEGASA